MGSFLHYVFFFFCSLSLSYLYSQREEGSNSTIAVTGGGVGRGCHESISIFIFCDRIYEHNDCGLLVFCHVNGVANRKKIFFTPKCY